MIVKPRKKILESDVEAAHIKNVAKHGGWSLKFTSPSRRNVPDRIDLYSADIAVKRAEQLLKNLGIENVPSAVLKTIVQEALAAAVQFTELKRPGVAPSEAQLREHQRLRKRGFVVNVVDEKV